MLEVINNTTDRYFDVAINGHNESGFLAPGESMSVPMVYREAGIRIAEVEAPEEETDEADAEDVAPSTRPSRSRAKPKPADDAAE